MINDYELIKGINVDLQVIVVNFKNSFSEPKCGWIKLDKVKIIDCLDALERIRNQAKKMNNRSDYMLLMKCISTVAIYIYFYYQKPEIIDQAGCGENLYNHFTSVSNICYFIEKYFIESKNVQLFMLQPCERNYYPVLCVTAPIAWSQNEGNFIIGNVCLVSHENSFDIVVTSISNPSKKINIHLEPNAPIQTITLHEIEDNIFPSTDIASWDDSNFQF